MKIIVFDLEIKNPIDGVKVTWDDKDKMGISIGVAYSYNSGEYHTFMDDNLPDLWRLLKEAHLITGFNIKTFDIPLLLAEMKNQVLAWEKPINNMSQHEAMVQLDSEAKTMLDKCYDVMVESKQKGAVNAAKLAGVSHDPIYAKHYKLDDHLLATYGDWWLKTAAGAEAPRMYQEGRIGELISYCLGDVHRERLMFEHCWYVGKIKAMGWKDGKEAYPIERPQDMLKLPVETRLPWTMFRTTDKGLSVVMNDFREPMPFEEPANATG